MPDAVAEIEEMLAETESRSAEPETPLPLPPESGPPAVPEPVEEPPASAPVTEVVEELPPVEEPPVSSPPVAAAPPAPAALDPAQTEVELLRAQRDAALAQLNEVSARAQAQPAQATPPPAPLAEKFVTDEEYETAISSADGINTLMNKVMGKAVEQSLVQIPAVVSHLVEQRLHLQGMIENFYQVNPDLKQYKDFVAFVSNSMASQNPGWTYEQLFTEVPKVVRERLRIAQANGTLPVAVQPQAPPRRAPAFAGVRGARAAVPDLEGFDKEFQDLLGPVGGRR